MSTYDDVKVLIAQFTGQQNIIGIPRILCKFMGSLDGGAFLSQVIYWSDKGGAADGFFYKSYTEWEEETSLSEYKVRKHAKELETMGVLEMKLKRANSAPTLHYRFDSEKFTILILEFLRIHDSEKFKNRSLKISESLTEITTETTTQTTKGGAQSAQPPAFLPEQFALGVKAIQEMKFTRTQWATILEAEQARGGEARTTLVAFIEKKLSANQHPAVQAYREETHYYPPAEWGARIAEQVGTNGSLDLWRNVVAGYVGCGWNPRNVKGMLEHFARGEVPTTNKPAPARARGGTSAFDEFERLMGFVPNAQPEQEAENVIDV